MAVIGQRYGESDSEKPTDSKSRGFAIEEIVFRVVTARPENDSRHLDDECQEDAGPDTRKDAEERRIGVGRASVQEKDECAGQKRLEQAEDNHAAYERRERSDQRQFQPEAMQTEQTR
jgi:hypothetical protein